MSATLLKSFGLATAELERRELSKYFVSTRAYLNAKRELNRKVYYIGHRGSGKSALFSQLTQEVVQKSKGIAINIQPTEFSYETFQGRHHNLYNVIQTYRLTWIYTLLVVLMQNIIANFERRGSRKSDQVDLKLLKSYLEREGHESPGILTIFTSFLAHFRPRTLEVGSVKLDFVAEEKRFIQASSLEALGRELTSLRRLAQKRPVYIFIDELDTGWDNSTEANDFIAGLFYAIERIKRIDNVFPFISLRTDMYTNIKDLLPDDEKMRDEIEEFSWNQPKLETLIARRIQTFWSGDNVFASNQDALDHVFELGALDYIIDRSLMRPREVIQLCNRALDELKNDPLAHGVSPKYTHISTDIIKRVEEVHSSNRFDDIMKEYKHQLPNLDRILAPLFHGVRVHTQDKMREIASDIVLEGSVTFGDAHWIAKYVEAPYDLVELLFQIGIIKCYDEAKSKYVGYYDSHIRSFDRVPRFAIHEVFCPAMSIAVV